MAATRVTIAVVVLGANPSEVAVTVGGVGLLCGETVLVLLVWVWLSSPRVAVAG
jgi:hypothetical protein